MIIPGLEPGRGYALRISKVGPAAPGDDWVDLKLTDAGEFIAQERLDSFSPNLSAAVFPSRSDSVRLDMAAGGDLDSWHEIRVEWQAAPVGRMQNVARIDSPNQGQRPAGATVTTVVVHATVIPTLERTVYHFLNPGSQVSAHYVVGRDGTIVQMVEDTGRAWHAGVSELEGVKGVNDFSVGIEIVNLNDGKDPFTDAQYSAVASIIRHLRQQYVIPDSRIVSHAHVARPIGRKSDPVGFDFPHLLNLARQ